MSLTAPLQTEHYTFQISRGASERVPWAFTEIIGSAENPVDLAGKTLEISFIAQGETVPFFVMDSEGEGNILGDPLGSSTLTLTPADPDWDFEIFIGSDDSALMPLGRGKWYLMMIEGSDREVLWNDFLSVKELYG
jgi:hypothetical protein